MIENRLRNRRFSLSLFAYNEIRLFFLSLIIIPIDWPWYIFIFYFLYCYSRRNILINNSIYVFSLIEIFQWLWQSIKPCVRKKNYLIRMSHPKTVYCVRILFVTKSFLFGWVKKKKKNVCINIKGWFFFLN